MNAITKIKSGIKAATKSTFVDTATGIGLSEAQVRSMIRSGASLDGIVVSNDIALTKLAEMLDDSGSDRDEIMKQAYTAAFTAAGHTDAAAMADEIIAGADISEVVRRHATHDVVIKSGRVEFNSAEEAATHVAGLTKEGKKAFFAGLKTVVKVNGIEEDEVPLGDFFKKYMPATAATDPDPDEPDNDADDVTDDTATEMPTGCALILVKDEDVKEDTKVFAANVALYGDAATIKAIVSGKTATLKSVTKVAGVKTATADYFSKGKVKYLRHKNELSESFSLMDKPKDDKKKS